MNSYFDRISLGQPWMLLLLLIIPIYILWYYYRHRRQDAAVQISDTSAFFGMQPNWRVRFRHVLVGLRLVALMFIIIALARPQSSISRQDVSIEGIDIVVALDISSSMLAEDFDPNRLEAAKTVAGEFIDSRPNDRIGLVVFSGEAFTQCPLTTDHAVLHDLFSAIKSGMIQDGTAIGDGLATAVNRLKESTAVSRVIILLTDGENNAGNIDPLTAAELANTYGIRLYTIGVGTIGTAPYPFDTPFGKQYQNVEVKIDENLLTKMAGVAGGQYFRATNNESLKKIYADIDKLEKSKIDVTEFRKHNEEFLPFALIALILLVAELLLRNTVFRSIH